LIAFLALHVPTLIEKDWSSRPASAPGFRLKQGNFFMLKHTIVEFAKIKNV